MDREPGKETQMAEKKTAAPTRIQRSLIIGCALWSAVAHADDHVTRTTRLKLTQMQPVDAIVLLRTIAGCKHVSAVDEQWVQVVDTVENLVLAERVVALADVPFDSSQPTLLTAEDGSVILSLSLQYASLKDVMIALRSDVKVAHIATLEPSGIMVRDTEEQVKAALELVQRLDQEAELSDD